MQRGPNKPIKTGEPGTKGGGKGPGSGGTGTRPRPGGGGTTKPTKQPL